MKKVLIASAYQLFIRKYSNLLIRMGFRLFTATSASVAFSLHAKHNFDIMLLDYRLEDMSGTTFCSLVRTGSVSSQVPIIITCHNVPGSIERVKACGASSILIKPIEPLNLINAIESFLDMQLVRSRRAELRVNVLCKTQELNFTCFSHDISNTGILLETDIDLELGSRLYCQFTLPNDCQIDVNGVVIRFKTAPEYKILYGVKYIAPTQTLRKLIDDYIEPIQAEIPMRIDKANDIHLSDRLVSL